MAKVKMEWKEFYEYCEVLADQILAFDPDVLIAIPRGGMTPAHVLGKMLNLPVGFYIPNHDDEGPDCMKNLTLPSGVYGMAGEKRHHKYAFVEDLIAEGRTYERVKKFMHSMKKIGAFNEKHPDTFDWTYNVVLVDAGYKGLFREGRDYSWDVPHGRIVHACTSDDWVVFPWENFDAVVDGDRGLFREGTDEYGK